MRSKHRVPLYGILAAALLVAAGAAAPAAADGPTQAPTPIGPHEYFNGVVNGVLTDPVISVVCPGPVGSGSTGHPVAGQSVSVVPAGSSGDSTAGYTGPADHIAVAFGASSISGPIVLDSYGTGAEIPTTLELPCGGTGTVVFNPEPVSDTGMPAIVRVTYRNIAV